jgi:hypothetical protein
MFVITRQAAIAAEPTEAALDHQQQAERIDHDMPLASERLLVDIDAARLPTGNMRHWQSVRLTQRLVLIHVNGRKSLVCKERPLHVTRQGLGQGDSRERADRPHNQCGTAESQENKDRTDR